MSKVTTFTDQKIIIGQFLTNIFSQKQIFKNQSCNFIFFFSKKLFFFFYPKKSMVKNEVTVWFEGSLVSDLRLVRTFSSKCDTTT